MQYGHNGNYSRKTVGLRALLAIGLLHSIFHSHLKFKNECTRKSLAATDRMTHFFNLHKEKFSSNRHNDSYFFNLTSTKFKCKLQN